MLVVGPIAVWHNSQKQLPQIEGVAFVDFSDLTAETLALTKPDFILSALMSAGFDAMDMARVLAELGYKGSYRAVSEELPCPDVVVADVGAVAPDLDFDVVQLNGAPLIKTAPD